MNTPVRLLFVVVLALLCAPLTAQMPAPQGMFEWGLKLPHRAVPRRVEQGGIRVPVGEKQVLAELAGPGCIRHMWFTGVFPGRQYVLRIFFDGQETPHVEAPLSDFFGVMHNLAGFYEGYRINTPFLTQKPKNSMSCYFPMPFAKSARVELVRDAMEGEPKDADIMYYIIDFHEYPDQKLEETQRFCARWRRESPVRDYADDFIVVDADGPGRFVGFVHSIDMLQSRFQMRWSHAGADNIYIDGDGRQPAYLRGIGGEDSFDTSFGGNEYQVGTSLYSDMPYYLQKDPDGDKQKLVGYRFFAADAITFEKSLHMRFGSRAHDVATTVYWYSSAPVRPYYRLPPAGQRKPGSEVRRGEYDLALPDTGKWWIAGPFDVKSQPALPLKSFDPTSALDGRKWREVEAIRGFVEFNHVLRPEATNKNSPTLVDVSAVASCALDSPTAGMGQLTLGWDDQLTVAVNDAAPIELGGQHYLRGRTIEVPLIKGANRIAVRLSNTTGLTRGSWNFAFSAVGPDGQKLLPTRQK